MRSALVAILFVFSVLAPARAADAEVSHLIGELGSSEQATRDKAVAQFGALGKKALLPLVRALGEDAVTRVAALQALEKLGPDSVAALPYVMLALGHNHFETGRAAIKVLAAMKGPAIARVIRGLDDEAIRFVCIHALAEFGSAAKDSVPKLVKLLERERHFRSAIIETLVKIGPHAIEGLRQAVANPTPEVSGPAAVGLAELDGAKPELVKPLIAAVEAKDSTLAIKAIEQLARMGPAAAEAVPAIKKRLAWATGYLKSTFATALVRIAPSDPDALNPLVEAALADDWGTAGDSLKKIGKPAVEALVAHAKDRNPMARKRVAKHLGEIGQETGGVVDVLVGLCADPESSVRQHAARALGKLGAKAKSASPALEKLFTDPNPEVVETARHALREINQ